MSRQPSHDILFEPVRIGPVVAPNRFYQVPHCSGMPHRVPQSHAAMREMKAEGGWGVVSTEAVSIHPTTDGNPTPEDHLWDEYDVTLARLMVERVKARGSLAACELVHHGAAVANRYSREIPLSPRAGRLLRHKDPIQARRMDKQDIRDLRRWHRDAALRARDAGYDIVYVYAGHEVSLPLQFIWRRFNDRTDEYGGSLVNRTRLLRELLEETHEAVGDRCAVALRMTVEELLGEAGITADGEGREIVEMLAELPDLWDVTVSAWANDSATARFADEGWQTEHVGFVKSLTTKPVVGTGRFTSPDLMAAMVRRGCLDLIGAARPSIADPFLPRKIEEGRYDDIRECIGCNMCVTGNNTAVPIRCTQNPTMGEEWRSGWHPERVTPLTARESVLIVGGGPSGLEAARILGERGCHVLLAERTGELGGRLLWERRLPGLATWIRVRDYRLGQISRMSNVEVYLESEMAAEDILSYGIANISIATGSSWRRDGVGQAVLDPLDFAAPARIFTPEEIAAGTVPEGPVVIYDDDSFFLGSCLAEKLALAGVRVVLATPAAEAAAWTQMTLEQAKIQTRLLSLDVEIVPHSVLAGFDGDTAAVKCVFTGRRRELPAHSLVLVTERLSHDSLYEALVRDPIALADAGIGNLRRIGDCFAPATVAHAVYSGHLYGRQFATEQENEVRFLREHMSAGSPAALSGIGRHPIAAQ